MRIETERLIIRNYELMDKEDLCEYMLQRVNSEFEGYPDFTAEKAESEIKYRMESDEFYAVELKDSKKVIGNIYLGKRDFNSREIGYVLNENYHRQGYITEGCIAVIEYMFKAGVHRIYAECAPQNTPSWKVMEKVGMEREAHFRKNVSFHNDANGEPIYWDTYVYAILNNM
ncbi:Acetyltransferase, GNAT family [Clostridium bornimense]|uniref:Acetyltransferase, GNAT family n=1 Tax=Clostridium bornimense TaxID=1216932 RepID=W6RZH3_9CLOT|nr:GNAT family protein [Clostridium bornimense]CDM69009.1 Acetyltransferase, GNAT family [Clostridium bornimense]